MPTLTKEAAVVKYLRTCATKVLVDVESFKIHSGLYSGATGFPDLIFLWEGKSLFIEAKTATGKLSINQAATHTAMRKCKIPVWIAKPVSGSIFEFKAELPGKLWEIRNLDVTSKFTWETLFKGCDV